MNDADTGLTIEEELALALVAYQSKDRQQVCEINHRSDDHPAEWRVVLSCGCEYYCCNSAKNRMMSNYERNRDKCFCNKCFTKSVRPRQRIPL